MIDTSFMETRYDFESVIDELFDEALNKLSPDDYEKLLDSVSMMLADRGL